MGWYRYMTHLQGYLWRPSGRLQAKLDAAMQQTGLADALSSGPVIGMHVRHGDSCYDDARGRMCLDFDVYMQYARMLRKQTGASTIFLASDSQYVLKEASKIRDFKVRTHLRPWHHFTECSSIRALAHSNACLRVSCFSSSCVSRSCDILRPWRLRTR